VINETLNEADQKMSKAVGVTREEFATIRAGRANPSMFAKLCVVNGVCVVWSPVPSRPTARP